METEDNECWFTKRWGPFKLYWWQVIKVRYSLWKMRRMTDRLTRKAKRSEERGFCD